MFGASVQYIRTLKSPGSHYFHATLQLYNLPGDWAIELLKPQRYGKSSSLKFKTLESLGFRAFVGDVIRRQG